MSRMKATVVIDNIEYSELAAEWGLCIYIEHRDKVILLDTGSSDLFAENAQKLGLCLQNVDFGVLSHAHYDHANGMPAFFEVNTSAPFFIRESSAENCYHKKEGEWKYIGMPEGIFEKYSGRMIISKGIEKVSDGAYLIPHSTPNLADIGKKEEMKKLVGDEWVHDDFAHEQSLVLETQQGLVIFNSCSHGGVVNIIHEVEKVFPGQKICGYIGGFHLYNKSAEEVRTVARELKKAGVERIYTGHCTGDEAFRILHEELGDIIQQFYTGLVIEF